LEAGADDCLSGGLDFRELDLRLRQAITAGSKPIPDGAHSAQAPATDGTHGGRVPLERLRGEISRRSQDSVQRFFCVLDIHSETLRADRLEEILSQQVRTEDGDLVTTAGGRCAVLLQGARESQLGAFLDRLHMRLDEAENGRGTQRAASVQVLSHPADADRISALLGTERDAEA
jgi:hypothetical protein